MPTAPPPGPSSARWSRCDLSRLRSVYLPFVALAVLALVWGYNWVVMKVGVRDCDPFTFAALRNFLGALALFAVVIVRKGSLRPKALVWTAVYGVLQTSLSGLAVWAVYEGSAGRTSVLVYTMPFWMLLIAWPVLGERVRGLQWLAVGMALVGLILVVAPWNLRGWQAVVLAVSGGLSWAIASVLFKVMTRRHTVELLPFAAWQTLLGSLPLVAVALIVDDTGPTWTGSLIAALVYNVIVAGALAYVTWLFILRSLPAGTAGISSLAIPVVGVVSAWIQLGERPGSWEALGMVFILGALALLTARGIVLTRRTRQLSQAAE